MVFLCRLWLVFLPSFALLYRVSRFLSPHLAEMISPTFSGLATGAESVVDSGNDEFTKKKTNFFLVKILARLSRRLRAAVVLVGGVVVVLLRAVRRLRPAPAALRRADGPRRRRRRWGRRRRRLPAPSAALRRRGAALAGAAARARRLPAGSFLFCRSMAIVNLFQYNRVQ